MKTVAALALACIALAVGGCSSSTQPGAASGCYPSRLRVSDAQVSAGGRLTVSSPPFRCQARYPAGKTYTLRLLRMGRAAPVEVRGWLRMTGGPSNASQPGIPGTVSFVDRATGDRYAATATADGSFTVTVPSGWYMVTGTSPLFMDGQSSCGTAVPTVVPASGLAGVVVACSRK